MTADLEGPPPPPPTPEEAAAETARTVLAGRSRGHVSDARELAVFVIAKLAQSERADRVVFSAHEVARIAEVIGKMAEDAVMGAVGRRETFRLFEAIIQLRVDLDIMGSDLQATIDRVSKNR